jgi:D-alanyl-lipoteichoic acid acyltransferase DltB (MBOAT superfamily)
MELKIKINLRRVVVGICILVSMYILLDFIFTCKAWQIKALQLNSNIQDAWVYVSPIYIGIKLWLSDLSNWVTLVLGIITNFMGKRS